jgi:predicted deacylase
MSAMMRTGVLTVGEIAAKPGQQVRGKLKLTELADGVSVDLPLLLVNGAKPGPRLYLGAAIHGDEVNGIAILYEALRGLDPALLSGQIVCVPVQHPLALHADHRLPLAQFLKSPLDQAPADAWTCFPGLADGNPAQRLAHLLFGLIRECDYLIDVHTPTRGGRYVPISILPPQSLDKEGRVLAFARGVGSGWIMRSSNDFYVSPGILCVEAARMGIPGFTFEIGEGGRLEPEIVEVGKGCILNALESLHMLSVERSEPAQVHLMKEFVGLRAKAGGLLYNHAKLGQAVKRGDLLVTIRNIFGDEVERIISPIDGYAVRLTTLSTVSTGERVATLGVLEG